jgi:glycine dehydrogenase
MVALRYAAGLARLSSQPSLSFARRSRGLASIKPQASLFSHLDAFSERHIGPDDQEASQMLSKIGYSSMDAFIEDTVPHKIRISTTSVNNTSIPALSESQLHARAKALGGQNKVFKSYIGMGYHAAVVPPVILRNVRQHPPHMSLKRLIYSY